MKNKTNYFILFLLLAFTYSCVSEFKVKLPDIAGRVLVVEGDIYSDSTIQFWFSYSQPLNEPEQYPDLNLQAELYVIGSNGYKSARASYLGNGCHEITIPPLDKEVEYAIEFTLNGETYQSSMIKPVATPPIDEVSFYQKESYADVEILVSTHTNEAAYFMWNYTEDWEFTADYAFSIIYDLEKRRFIEYDRPPVYYCWKRYKNRDILVGSTEKLSENKIANHQLYKNESESKRFSVLYSTQIEQKGLSKAAYEYYLDLQKANQDMGGLFTPQPSGIEGNIKCTSNSEERVIGFVDVSYNVAYQRIFIKSGEVSRKHYSGACEEISGDSISSIMKELEKDQDYIIRSMGYHPIIDNLMVPPLSVNWIRHNCYNCTLSGTKNKPSFWPNNHE